MTGERSEGREIDRVGSVRTYRQQRFDSRYEREGVREKVGPP